MEPIIVNIPIRLRLDIQVEGQEEPEQTIENLVYDEKDALDIVSELSILEEGKEEKVSPKEGKKAGRPAGAIRCYCGKKLHHKGRHRGKGLPPEGFRTAKQDRDWAEKLRKEEEYMEHARKELE